MHSRTHSPSTFKSISSASGTLPHILLWITQHDGIHQRDTVNSVGLIPRRLPFTMSNTNVRIFRHAVSLDERRAKFKQNHWNHPSEKESKLAHTDRPGHEHYGNHSQHKHSQKHQQKHLERQYSVIPDSPTNVEEVGIFDKCWKY